MKRLYIYVLGLALLSGCSSSGINIDYNRQADFTELTTFAFPDHLKKPVINPNESPVIHKQIKQSIVNTLNGKGFIYQEENPSFLVSYTTEHYRHIQVKPLFDEEWLGLWQDEVTERQWQEGKLIVDIIDTASGEVVWRGWTEKRIEKPSDMQKKFNTVFERLFAHFPPDK